MREIQSDADPNRQVMLDESEPTAADVLLVVERDIDIASLSICLDVKARRELIEALTATLPTEA